METCLRLLLLGLIRLCYRLRVRGREHVPTQGGALLVANHVSFVDALLLSAALGRRVCFLMHKRYYSSPWIGWFARLMGAIPVAAEDSTQAKRQALSLAAERAREGELVCIFAEGAITRSGALQAFRRGLERIAQAAAVPIVPVALDRLWGSVFSFASGRVFWKWPCALPYAVDLAFAEPLPAETPAWRVRLSVAQELAEGRRMRAQAGPTLGARFLRSIKQHAHRLALIDASGEHWTYRRLGAAAIALRPKLLALAQPGDRVAVLLPPGLAGVLANVALALHGFVSVNLNATLSTEELCEQSQRAGAAHLLTSRRYLEALQRAAPLAAQDTSYLEDLVASLSRGQRIRAWLATFLPRSLLLRRMCSSTSALDTATILYSSGSTGPAKGVELSHANILANVRGILDAIALRPDDRLLGSLPLFHSFGYTVTVWTVLSAGACGVYAPNPLDGQAIAKLCREEAVSVIVSTPTFMQSWLRRFERASVARVRLCLVGAEKLRPALAQAWRERMGLEIYEGYGCTELAPVVALSLPDSMVGSTCVTRHKPDSVGRPLPGIALRVVAPESGALLPPGAEGLIEVASPALMRGYWQRPDLTAEVVQDGWYRTGDIGWVDDDGFLFLTDRLARFSKIGGEMVPHGRVESVLQEIVQDLAPQEDVLALPELAVVGLPDEVKGEVLCVVHTPFSCSMEAVMHALAESDLPRLFRPRAQHFITVSALPKTATGKTDLAALKRTALRTEPGTLAPDSMRELWRTKPRGDSGASEPGSAPSPLES